MSTPSKILTTSNVSKRPTLLVDVDEVLFPFAHAYDRWLVLNRGHGLEPEAMRRYAIADAAGAEHSSLAVNFVNDKRTIQDEPPLVGALDAVVSLNEHFKIVACTSRRSGPEGAATRAWIDLHLPPVSDVIFTSEDHGKPLHTKGFLARRHGAIALIDDTPENLVGLPSTCTGFLFRRPSGIDSSAESIEWNAVVETLIC